MGGTHVWRYAKALDESHDHHTETRRTAGRRGTFLPPDNPHLQQRSDRSSGSRHQVCDDACVSKQPSSQERKGVLEDETMTRPV